MATPKIDRSLDVKPLDADGVKTFQIGTAAFIIALIVCIAVRNNLVEHGQEWWIWTCVTGIIVGILGVVYTSRRARVYAEARLSDESTPSASDAGVGTTSTGDRS